MMVRYNVELTCPPGDGGLKLRNTEILRTLTYDGQRLMIGYILLNIGDERCLPQKRINKSQFAKIDDMTWPLSNQSDLAWILRYASVRTIEDRLKAASVIDAYNELVSMPQDKRNAICNALNSVGI